MVGRPPARDRGHQLDLDNAGPLASRSTRVEEYLSRAWVGRPTKARVRERWRKEGIRGFKRSHERAGESDACREDVKEGAKEDTDGEFGWRRRVVLCRPETGR